MASFLIKIISSCNNILEYFNIGHGLVFHEINVYIGIESCEFLNLLTNRKHGRNGRVLSRKVT